MSTFDASSSYISDSNDSQLHDVVMSDNDLSPSMSGYGDSIFQFDSELLNPGEFEDLSMSSEGQDFNPVDSIYLTDDDVEEVEVLSTVAQSSNSIASSLLESDSIASSTMGSDSGAESSGVSPSSVDFSMLAPPSSDSQASSHFGSSMPTDSTASSPMGSDFRVSSPMGSDSRASSPIVGDSRTVYPEGSESRSTSPVLGGLTVASPAESDLTVIYESATINETVEENVISIAQILPALNVINSEVEPKPGVSGEQTGSNSLKRPHVSDDDDDDGQTCMICMEVWSNSGSHRLVSLRCGHLFGNSCIRRWLQGTKQNGKRCPQCNSTALLKDVRLVYAKKLVALDTVERDEMKNKLHSIEMEKNKIELDLKKAELQNQLQAKALTELRAKLEEAQRAQLLLNSNTNPSSQNKYTENPGNMKLVPHSKSVLCKGGGCRVLAFKESLNLLVASQSSNSPIFQGYGICKLNTLNFVPTQFIFLHKLSIRDLAFHPLNNDLLLSVSLDKSAKLLDVTSKNVVQTFITDHALWSCCWDVDNPNLFYVGNVKGSIFQYDMRKTTGPLWHIDASRLGVVSLAAIPSNPGGVLPRGGFLAAHINSFWVYEPVNGKYVGKQLPMDGPFTSMRYDKKYDHILLTSRPSGNSFHVRHVVCQLSRSHVDNLITIDQLQVFEGGHLQSLMSRTCQISKGDNAFIAGYNESTSAVAVWNMANGTLACKHKTDEAIFDICPVSINGQSFLCTISESMLRVYRVQEDSK